MSFRAICSHCATAFNADDRLEGREGQCLKCGKHFTLVRAAPRKMPADESARDSGLPQKQRPTSAAEGAPPELEVQPFPLLSTCINSAPVLAMAAAIVGFFALVACLAQEAVWLALICAISTIALPIAFLVSAELFKLGLAIEKNTRMHT